MAKAGVQVGKKIPRFQVAASNGDIIAPSVLKDKYVILYFYPKDNTPGCTTEGNDFKKINKKCNDLEVVILGVSRDSIRSHQKFIEKFEFPFLLLSDEEEVLCQMFDVMKIKSLYGKKFRGVERSTFFIDKKGVLREEWRNVKVPNHATDVLEFVEKYIAENKK